MKVCIAIISLTPFKPGKTHRLPEVARVNDGLGLGLAGVVVQCRYVAHDGSRREGSSGKMKKHDASLPLTSTQYHCSTCMESKARYQHLLELTSI